MHKANAIAPNDKRVLFKLFLTNYLDMIAFGIFIPILPFLFSDKAPGIFYDVYDQQQLKTLFGWLVAGFSICSMLGSPLIGAVSDRIGRKKMLLFAYIINTISYLLMAGGIYLISLTILFLGRIIPGLMGNTQITIQSALADISDEKTKAKNFGITGISFGLGFVSGVLIFIVLNHFGFSFVQAYILAAVINVFNIVFLLGFVPETLTKKTVKSLHWLTGVHNLIFAFTHPRYRLIFGVIFMLTSGFVFFTQYLQFYLVDKFNFNEQEVGQMLIYLGLWIAVVQGLLLPPISRRFAPTTVLLWSIPLFSASFLLLLLPQNAFWFYLLTPVLICFQGITFPTTLAVVSNMASTSIQGEIMGINQSVQATANWLPSASIGFLVGWNISFPIWFGAIVCFASCLLYWHFYQSLQQ